MEPSTKGHGREKGDADRRDIVRAGYRYAYSLAHHPQDAEDLMQQACLRVYQSKGDLQDLRYLFVTIRNLFRDQGRRKALAKFETLPRDSMVDRRTNSVAASDDRLDIETMLAKLESEEREMLYLSCAQGFTAAEISEIMSKPRGTVTSQLSRIKKKLSERFGQASGEENLSSENRPA